MRGKRILIVEDEPGIALALCRALEHPLGGNHRVEISPVGETALAKLQAERYDLLVTDLRMPGMSGLELIRRGCRISPEMRTMLITAFGSPEIEGLSHELGAVYLPKPFGAWEFISAVRRALGEGRQTGWDAA